MHSKKPELKTQSLVPWVFLKTRCFFDLRHLANIYDKKDL